MATPAPALLRSANEYLVRIRERTDSLKAHARHLASSEKESDKVSLYFIRRIIQIADTCFFASAKQTPLLVMSRVLCEDLLVLFWISQSEKRALEYGNICRSQWAKMARVNATRGRVKFRRKSTGEDVTKSFLPELSKFILDINRVEAIADSCGLSRIYDFVYRFHSLELHAFTYGIMENEKDLRSSLCAVVAMLNAVLLIAENRGRPTTTTEILGVLGLESFDGA